MLYISSWQMIHLFSNWKFISPVLKELPVDWDFINFPSQQQSSCPQNTHSYLRVNRPNYIENIYSFSSCTKFPHGGDCLVV